MHSSAATSAGSARGGQNKTEVGQLQPTHMYNLKACVSTAARRRAQGLRGWAGNQTGT